MVAWIMLFIDWIADEMQEKQKIMCIENALNYFWIVFDVCILSSTNET